MGVKNGGSEEKLSKEQSEQLESHLREHTNLYVKDIVAYVLATDFFGQGQAQGQG